MTEAKLLRYQDVLKNNCELRSREELETQNIYLDWWSRAQLESRYRKDKIEGFYTEKQYSINFCWAQMIK